MKLIIPASIAADIKPRLARLAPDCALVCVDDEGTPDGDLSDADMYFRWWTPTPIFLNVLAQAPNVRWVHTPSAGVDHLLSSPELADSDIQLTNSAGAHAIPIAEFVMLYMLFHVKRGRELMHTRGHSAWLFEEREELDELAGKIVLLIGFGAIGQEIARRAQAFGMRVIASRRTPTPAPVIDVVVGPDGWRELLPEADFVVIAAPLTEATRGMIGTDELARLQPGAYLINIARGAILDQAALIAALQAGRLAGAALDVTEPEPPPDDDPIWDAPNVWVTPHISGSSPRTRERQFDIFFDNLQRYRDTQPLRNLVDKEAGY